jgi:hypothetical protein
VPEDRRRDDGQVPVLHVAIRDAERGAARAHDDLVVGARVQLHVLDLERRVLRHEHRRPH